MFTRSTLATLDEILHNIPGARPDPVSWEEYLQAWWNRFLNWLDPHMEIDDGLLSLNRKIRKRNFCGNCSRRGSNRGNANYR